MTSPEPGPVASEHNQQLKVAVREVLGLAADHTVVVKELACAEPGRPPTETVIAVWPSTGRSRRWTLHRPLADVTPDDVRRALTAPDESAADSAARTTTPSGDR